MSGAASARGVGAYGHRLRRATADEQMAGTNPIDGSYVQRPCRHCLEPAAFAASYFLEGPDRRPRLRRHYLCLRHAGTFATRHRLELPPPLRTDQVLLPFGSGGAADGNANLSL